MTDRTDGAKAAAAAEVAAARDALVDLSHRIWDHPELAFEEERTSAAAAQTLADAGFDDLDPAEFRRYGSARNLYTFKVDNAGAY